MKKKKEEKEMRRGEDERTVGENTKRKEILRGRM